MADILVVDDRASNRDLLVTLLGYAGHQVTEAVNGLEALTAVRAARPDLVITDLVMPVMDGYELVRELRADPATASVRVVFYTAQYLAEEVGPAAEACRVQHVISKPAEPAEILATVATALSEPVDPAPVRPAEIDREYHRVLSAKLASKLDELEQVSVGLARSEGRFRLLAESAPVGILTIAAGGDLSYYNPWISQLLGWVTDEGPMTLATLERAVDPDDLPRVQATMAAALLAEEEFRLRLRVRSAAAGQTHWLDAVGVPMTGATGEAAGHVLILEDVTGAVEAEAERALAEARLRTSERLESLGALAGGIAHDFNNLLAVIVGFSDLVASGLNDLAAPEADLEQLRADIAKVQSATGRATELVSSLMAFGRQEQTDTRVLDLNLIITELNVLLRRTIGEHLELHADLASDLWPVNADRAALERVLVNLVVNARDAIGRAGQVTVRTANAVFDGDKAVASGILAAGRYVRMTVTDDGCGMDAATAQRIFEPFFTTKPRGKGTGLGMAAVHGVVHQAGGALEIASQLGEGSAISVLLPVAPAGATAAAEPPARTSCRGAGQTIVVVEDDVDLLQVTARVLEANGYRCVRFADGEQALRHLEDRSATVDLLLTDVVMPHLTGAELAERVQLCRPQLPGLFMSGYTQGLLGDHPGEGQIFALLAKPFTPDDLLQAVEQALSAGAGVP